MSHILPSPSHVHNSPPSLLDERPRHPTPLGPPPVQCHCFFHHPGPRLHPLDHDPTHLVYLLDHSCYLPPQHLRVLFGQFMDHSTLIGNFLPSSFDFQRKILLCFGLCEHTYVPQAMHSIPTRPFKATAREEAEQVMFGALDNLFSNTNDKLKDIRVLVINSSLFNPTPSLSAMMVNKYKLCDNIKSFNLGDMGYNTGVIIVDLVKDMLQFHCNTNAAIVSIDNITQNWYPSFIFRSYLLYCILTRTDLKSKIFAEDQRSLKPSGRWEINEEDERLMEAFISKEQETLVDLIVQRIKETNAFVASGNIKETDTMLCSMTRQIIPFSVLASGTCAQCFSSISLHLGLKERRRDKAAYQFKEVGHINENPRSVTNGSVHVAQEREEYVVRHSL
ncbi:3-ketoacyl-CoA synthase 4 [Glycine soja]